MPTPPPAWLTNGKPPEGWTRGNIPMLKRLLKQGDVVQQGFEDGLLHRWQATGEPFAFWAIRRRRVWIKKA